jgi:hypothetical protein
VKNEKDRQSFACELLTSRIRGERFSQFVSTLIKDEWNKIDMFSVFERGNSIAKYVEKPFLQIVKTRLLRIVYRDPEGIVSLAKDAAEELKGSQKSYLAQNNLLQALRFALV